MTTLGQIASLEQSSQANNASDTRGYAIDKATFGVVDKQGKASAPITLELLAATNEATRKQIADCLLGGPDAKQPYTMVGFLVVGWSKWSSDKASADREARAAKAKADKRVS